MGIETGLFTKIPLVSENKQNQAYSHFGFNTPELQGVLNRNHVEWKQPLRGLGGSGRDRDACSAAERAWRVCDGMRPWKPGPGGWLNDIVIRSGPKRATRVVPNASAFGLQPPKYIIAPAPNNPLYTQTQASGAIYPAQSKTGTPYVREKAGGVEPF